MRWSGPWKTDRLLKTAMVLTGTVLVLALAKPLAGETMKMISQHSKIPWKDSGSRCCMKRQKAKNK